MKSAKSGTDRYTLENSRARPFAEALKEAFRVRFDHTPRVFWNFRRHHEVVRAVPFKVLVRMAPRSMRLQPRLRRASSRCAWTGDHVYNTSHNRVLCATTTEAR